MKLSKFSGRCFTARLAQTLVLAATLTGTTCMAQAAYYNMALGSYTENFASITNTNVWVTPTTGSW